MPILRKGKLGFPMKTQDPFLFAVYHKDDFPAGNEKMEPGVIGDGMDFDPEKKFRMYHGTRVSGFPMHPHRGFETVTATMQGLIDHTDSLGGAGRYGQGDLQWMTAGSGIVHGENFPCLYMDKPNPTRFFQLWLNLPAKSKMVPPTQKMHWAEQIPKFKKDGVDITVWAGELEGITALTPPKDSWAADPTHNIGIFFIVLAKDASYTLPCAPQGTNRSLYLLSGSPLVDGAKIDVGSYAEIGSDSLSISNTSPEALQVLVLQGKPINEPVVQHGPFVMNTRQEIAQAQNDYYKTRFGGWPWDQDAVIFPRDKGRFVTIDGKTDLPPVAK